MSAQLSPSWAGAVMFRVQRQRHPSPKTLRHLAIGGPIVLGLGLLVKIEDLHLERFAQAVVVLVDCGREGVGEANALVVLGLAAETRTLIFIIVIRATSG